MLQIDDLTEQNKNIDIICITKYNMTSENKEYLTIPNYSLASSYCRDKSRGGACVLLTNRINISRIK